MRNIKVPPGVAAVAIVASLALVLFLGYNSYLAPRPALHGMINGRPMTDADEARISNAMSGGRAAIARQKAKERQKVATTHVTSHQNR